ncbi:MAG: hypothetical protein ACQUHE_03360 [Bacteroidia bacterium]
MEPKLEHIDAIPKLFNNVNKGIKHALREIIGGWDTDALAGNIEEIRKSYDALREALKYLFVEIRLNLTMLTEKQKTTYSQYCQITLKAIQQPIKTIEIERQLFQAFSDSSLTFDESYFVLDIAIAKDLTHSEASNYIFGFSLLLNYHHVHLENIFKRVLTIAIDDDQLTSMDKTKNTINQKLLLLYYLITTKRISINKLSQDDTKKARILSFLFDNGYENVRKYLPNLQESKSKNLKTKNNMQSVHQLFTDLGSEYASLSKQLEKEIKLST